MRVRQVTFFLLLAALVASVGPAHSQHIDVLAPTGQWVTDQADMLSAQEERHLTTRLESYAKSSSTQIVVVTVASLEGNAASDYATELGRSWGVGQEEYNNGVVLLVSRDDREVFIATGYGVEGAIPDAVAARIVRNVIIPRFKRGDFHGGISGAVDALIEASQGEYTAADPDEKGVPYELIVFVVLLIILIIFVVIIAATRDNSGGGGTRKKRRRRSRGPVVVWGGGGHRTGWGTSSGSWGSGSWGSGGGFGGGFSGGGFSGGGGSFGGGGAGGSW